MAVIAAALVYVVVLVATLIGLPGLGQVPLPGIDGLRTPADVERRTTVGDRTVEEPLPDLAPEQLEEPTTPTGDGITTTTAARTTTTAPVAPPPAVATSTTSAPATSAAPTTAAPPGQGNTTTTAAPPGQGNTTTTTPSGTSTSRPDRAPAPPSSGGPR